MSPFAPPLAGLRFSLVGPGRVGASLAAWAVARGARAVTVAGRSAARASEVAEALQATNVPLAELATEHEDLLLIAVADDAYAAVAGVLAERPQAGVVLHASGSLPMGALDPLAARGSGVGVLHPLKAFPRPLPDPAEARGVFFALGSDPAAVNLGRRLVEAWEGHAAVLAEEQRLLYHFAATLVAGGTGTLLASADALARRLGLPREVWNGYVELAGGALEQVGAADEPARAITGPAARGDWDLVRRQLAAAGELDPGLARLARALAEQTASLRGSRADLE
ncbi:MAG: DUF2520 domain-containing protein [Thermoanaerobaculia bacterium]